LKNLTLSAKKRRKKKKLNLNSLKELAFLKLILHKVKKRCVFCFVFEKKKSFELSLDSDG